MRIATLSRRVAAVELCVCLTAFAGNGTAAEKTAPGASAELARLVAEDQVDRKGGPATPNWSVLNERDEKRQSRIKALVASDVLRTGTDFYHAAMILQHSPQLDDSLLAHDLCVIAIGKGEARARWLAAATLDQYLVNTGRRQRFGTQYQSRSATQAPRLVEVDPAVPDSLRREMDVPVLADAKEKEAEFARMFSERQSVKPK